MAFLSETNKDTIIRFFFKRTNLYSWVGRIFAVALLTELSALPLPVELCPDYKYIIAKHGYFNALLTAFFIAKYFSGAWIVSLFIKTVILRWCFIFNLKLERKGQDYVLIKSWNIGIGNKNVTNITYNEKTNRNGKENN